jgi:hypothetical protein
MADLTKEEVMALGHAVGLEIQDPEPPKSPTASTLCWKPWPKLVPQAWIPLNPCLLSCPRLDRPEPLWPVQ